MTGRVYVRPEHRRRGLARRLVREVLAFAASDGGYRAVYLHTDPASRARRRAGGRWAPSSSTGDGQRIVHSEVPMTVPAGSVSR
ncbi:hypothetical protein GCM10010236_09750 [Streptomyces eurythermus]|nr:hypothetical protein GCM10010236_09750 [Streptomyces eurythermus]